MPLNRRRLLMISGFAGAAVLLGSAARLVSGPRHSYVKAVVRKRLHYLTFSEEVLEQFSRDFIDFTPAMNASRGKILSFGGVTLSRALGRIGGTDMAFRIDSFEQKIASDFLKATDFFDAGADTERALEYYAFPNPYTNPCRNALAYQS